GGHRLQRTGRKAAHYLISIHPRHDEIRYDTVWPPVHAALQRFQPIISYCHLIPLLTDQALTDGLGHISVIIYHQHTYITITLNFLQLLLPVDTGIRANHAP